MQLQNGDSIVQRLILWLVWCHQIAESFIVTLAHRAEERRDVFGLWHTVSFEEQLCSLNVRYDRDNLWVELFQLANGQGHVSNESRTRRQ